MSRRFWVSLTLSAWLPVALAACAAHPAVSALHDRDCITDFRAGTDYFPNKSTIVDATNFTLSYHDSYQVLTVEQPYPHGRPESYVLVRCGAPTPALTDNLAGAQPITVPVASLYSASITQLGMIAELGRGDVVTGVADTADVVDPQMRQRISSGRTVGYAPGSQINVEGVAAAHPDVLVSAGMDEPAYPKLRDAGVSVLADAEWLEPGSGFTAGLAADRAGVAVAAAVGAAVVLALILALARWVRSAASLLLIGVMVSAAATAVVSVLLVYADPQRVQQYLLWGLGSFAGTTWWDLRLLLTVVALGMAAAALTVRPLNALLLGESYARTMGIDVRRTRLISVVSASLLTGATTAFCGPIAFLGLAVPHLARLALGTSDHRAVLPTVVLMGSAVALACGIVSQVPGSDAVLPVNAVTALIGAPIVVLVLVRSRHGVGMQK